MVGVAVVVGASVVSGASVVAVSSAGAAVVATGAASSLSPSLLHALATAVAARRTASSLNKAPRLPKKEPILFPPRMLLSNMS